jgi:hypothetical protein
MSAGLGRGKMEGEDNKSHIWLYLVLSGSMLEHYKYRHIMKFIVVFLINYGILNFKKNIYIYRIQ